MEEPGQRLIDAALKWGETPCEDIAERDRLETELADACIAYRAAEERQ